MSRRAGVKGMVEKSRKQRKRWGQLRQSRSDQARFKAQTRS